MIMKQYNYRTCEVFDEYGDAVISNDVKGTIKMCINVISQNNELFDGSTFLGLTQAEVNNTYVIEYEDLKLRVLYVQPKGRYKQVYMGRL